MVVDARLDEGVAALAALAALAAVDHAPPASTGLMHDSVRSSGTPSSTPRAITADFSHATNGASIAIPCARPSDSARPIAAKNSGVASGNGLPASGPIAMRPILAKGAGRGGTDGTGALGRRAGPGAPELHTLRLTEELTVQVQEFARRRGVTVNTVVQGLWALLLARLTGGDVTFRATVSGRPAELAGVESMIGLFINTVPVRVTVTAGANRWPAFLDRLQDEQSRLLAHQHLGLADIQRRGGPGRTVRHPRSSSRTTPTTERGRRRRRRAPDTAVRRAAATPPTTRLTWAVEPAERLTVGSSSVPTSSTAPRSSGLAEALVRLLDGDGRPTPRRRRAAADVLTRRRPATRVLEAWNDTALPATAGSPTMPELFEAQAAAYAGRGGGGRRAGQLDLRRAERAGQPAGPAC